MVSTLKILICFDVLVAVGIGYYLATATTFDVNELLNKYIF